MAQRRRRRRQKGRAVGFVHAIGLGGLACILFAVFGLVQSMSGGTEAPPRSQTAAPVRQQPEIQAKRLTVTASYYPLEVGRFWVYRDGDGGKGFERFIERRERQGDRDLYFFDDGMVAYLNEGKIFEMGPEGGVNVIPVDPSRGHAPYLYVSEGMQIEKRLGALDTTVSVGGRRFDGCLEVVTEFRYIDSAEGGTLAYSSYFARGIGLVGRQRWPKREGADLSMALTNHGVKHL